MGTRTLAFALFACSWLAAPARAATEAQINAAVDKGVQFVESQQLADGSFQGHWHGEGYTSGETALALLALLKGGVAPDHPRIERGFTWLFEQPLKRTYEVSVAVLALEARYTPEAQASIQNQDPLKTQIRKRFKKIAPPRDRRWLQQAVDFLLRSQALDGSWKYPHFGDPDLSNAQFAVLALAAAQRMGLKVDPGVFLKAAEYLLTYQEASGPQVAAFPVPAADQSTLGLHDRRAKRAKQRRRGGTSEREAPPETVTAQAMHARGWGYRPGQGPRGSMTAAGLAILVVAKSVLEGERGYDRIGAQLDRAIRDGAAWLAHSFRADANPGAEPDWLFYYLYTLGRAGTLLALDRFGHRDWYAAGADVIVGHQQSDGSVQAKRGGESDATLAGSCLGVLFLERSTVPVIKRVVTGGGALAQKAQGGPAVRDLGDGSAEVTFRFSLTPGRRVSVAGSFNGWSPDASPMQDADGDGTYELRLELHPGRHTYKFVVDGDQWQPDPLNTEGEPDGHGGRNSVLTVP
jgi:hypothetical protein